MTDSKSCMSCGEVKPLGEYSPHPQTTDGRVGQCKACKAAYSRAYYRQHRERIREKWREASLDPDVAERKREQNRRWREKKRAEREADPEWRAKKAEQERTSRVNAARREASCLRRQERETGYLLVQMVRAESRRQRKEDRHNRVVEKRVRQEKACTKCGVVKPMTEFHPDPRRIDGRYSDCKVCKNRQSRESRDRRWGERRAERAAQKEEQLRRKRQQSAERFQKRLARSARIEAATYRRMEREAKTLQRQLVEGEKRRQRRLEKERRAEMPTTKTCTRCGQEKPMTEFYKRKDSADGRFGSCKPCHDALSAASRQKRRAKAEKPCRVCGVVKPMTDYTKDRKRLDGRASTCRECVADAKAESKAEEMAATPSKKLHQCQYAQCAARAVYWFDGDEMWRYCSIHVHVVQKKFGSDPKTYVPKKKEKTLSTELIITTCRRLRGAATEAQQHAATLRHRGESLEKVHRLEGEANGLQIAAGVLEQAAREAKQKDVT